MKFYKAIKLKECNSQTEEFYDWYIGGFDDYKNILTIQDLNHFLILEDVEDNEILYKEILDMKKYVVQNNVDLIIL